MLDDFLHLSVRTQRNGYVRLARDGFELILTANLQTITGYSTLHRERTWA